MVLGRILFWLFHDDSTDSIAVKPRREGFSQLRGHKSPMELEEMQFPRHCFLEADSVGLGVGAQGLHSNMHLRSLHRQVFG